MVVDAFQQAGGFEIRDDALAGIKTCQSAIGLRCLVVDAGIVVENVPQGQVVALPHGVVVKIVCGRNLDAARAKLGVDVVIGDHRDLAPSQWQLQGVTDEVLVTLVIGVNGDCAVTQQGFRAGGGHHDIPLTIGPGVAQMP